MAHDLVLLNPPTSPEERYGALSAGGSTLPPLGLAGLAAVAREAGFSVAIVDAEGLGLGVAHAAEAILALAPRVLGVTAVTMTIGSAAEVARQVKAGAPKTFAVAGGPHPTALPESTLRAYPWLDAVAIGESDETLPALLEALLRGTGDLHATPGLLLRNADGTFIRTAAREPLVDLDQLPLPAWDLLPDLGTHYRPPLNGVRALPATSLITSRGCAGVCTFCDRAVSGHRMRFHSPGYVIAAIDLLRDRYGIRDLHFHDDNLLARPSRLFELCRLLAERHPELTWSAEGRVDMVTPELLSAMKDAGCWQIAYGIESGSQAQLDRLCKGITLEQTRAAVRMTREAGIEVRGLFMIGTPGETRESLEATHRFMLSLGLHDMVLQTFSPHPGTQIAEEIGMPQDTPEEWARSSRWEIAYVPEGLTAEDLSAAQRRAFRAFYLQPRIIARYAWHVLSRPSLARELLRGLWGWLSFVARGQSQPGV